MAALWRRALAVDVPPSASGWRGPDGWKRPPQRGHVKPGDVAQFGCPPGWREIEDTALALRGHKVTMVHVGSDPPPYEGSVTCVAQGEFALPAATGGGSEPRPPRQPLAPVWVDFGADATTIGFTSEPPPGAPIYIARETPCGPRTIGARLGELLKWLVDPEAAVKRDFLGMISAGCPEGPAK